MIVNLQSLSEHLDNALDKGYFPITYPEFLVKSQIAVAERLEQLTEAVKALSHSEVPRKANKALESNPRASRRYSKAKDVYSRAEGTNNESRTHSSLR
jgi:hypothetical protein